MPACWIVVELIGFGDARGKQSIEVGERDRLCVLASRSADLVTTAGGNGKPIPRGNLRAFVPGFTASTSPRTTCS